MEEKSTSECNQNNFFKCPNCSCCFCTESDLKRHIESYGTTKTEHLAEIQRVHGRLEYGSYNGPE